MPSSPPDGTLYFQPGEVYHKPALSGSDNLTELFNLSGFALSVARTDPVTGAKRKLRKSYKGHIADLPGLNEIHTVHTILPKVYAPREQRPRLAKFDESLLDKAFDLEPTRGEPIPGFDEAVLGLVDVSHKGTGRSDGGGADSDGKISRKKRKKTASNGDLSVHATDEDESVKRQRRH